jgi:DNA-binding XRE family transcriptional regulator
MMTPTLTITRESKPGYKAHKLRIALHLTKQQLAEMAGVSREAIELFEHGLPVPLDFRRRILRELWAKKQEVTHVASLLVASMNYH